MAEKLTFSGHESFQCRHLWLKKGFDFLCNGNKFIDPSSVIKLGVGKNMVSSIRYWMRAFDLIDDNDVPTEFAQKLLSDEGWDPYIEDEGTIWLLHYLLIKRGLASSYSLVFNELRKERIEFTKSHFLSFINRKTELLGLQSISEKTLIDDFNVMIKMYIRTSGQSKDKEDSLAGLLTELDLIKNYGKATDEYFLIENSERNELPLEIFHYAIIDFSDNKTSIDLAAIEYKENSPGNIFAINRIGLINKIESICNIRRSNIIFSDHAGIKEIQFKKRESLFSILDMYYAK